jgi:hypothetical protein
MSEDVMQLLDGYLTDEPSRWGKLASDIQWRRLQLTLLREILIELRRLNEQLAEARDSQP